MPLDRNVFLHFIFGGYNGMYYINRNIHLINRNNFGIEFTDNSRATAVLTEYIRTQEEIQWQDHRASSVSKLRHKIQEHYLVGMDLLSHREFCGNILIERE